MGSKKIEPEFKMAPDAAGPSANLASILAMLTGQMQGGQTPGLSGPGVSTFDELLRTGLPINGTPLIDQASNVFNRTIAPGIMQGLGSNYGIRFGTPVADVLGRAGADVTTALNAELARYADAAQQRRGQAVALQQNAFMNALQGLIGGTGVFRQGSGFFQPQYAPSTGSQLFSTAAQVYGAYLGGPAGANLGKEAGDKVAGT